MRQRFDRALAKLRLRELRISQTDRVRNCDCLVFPKGHRDERIFFFGGEDHMIRVCELALHSDQSYERLIARGVRRDEYRGFSPLVISPRSVNLLPLGRSQRPDEGGSETVIAIS